MGLTISYELGATPLDPDEAHALIPRHLATQSQLNEWEHSNIVKGQQWALATSRKELLSTEFMRELHKQMLGDTWHWAGDFRTTEKNIGVAPETISVRLRELCDDVREQLRWRSYSIREIAARFHHRLVLIHPFPNGNGRFSRLMADLLLIEGDEEPFVWGDGDLVSAGDVRERYLEALRAADGHNYGPLLDFLALTNSAPDSTTQGFSDD